MNRAGIVLATALIVFPIAALARAPWTPAGADEAILRYSWRLGSADRTECRTRSAEELEALPVHMRAPEVCERDRATYMLVTSLDGAAPDSLVLTRGGMKGDRPLFVLGERRLPPGRHSVDVTLYRIADGATTVVSATRADIHFAAGDVHLVTSGEGHDLVVRSPAPRTRP
jgi:hypothetical protein